MSSPNEVAKAIRATQASIPTIRTGTVVTDYGDPNTGTYVSLDNDPTSTPVRAVTGQFLSAGTRVLLVSFPPRGLAIIEVLSERASQSSGVFNFITTGIATFPETLIPAGAIAIRFLLQGGGGGSGSTTASTATTGSATGGAAGGDMVEGIVYLDGLQFAASFNYQVGGGGIGATTSNAAGGAGGSTILNFIRYGTAVTWTASGGAGSPGSGATASPTRTGSGNFSSQISGGATALGAIVYPGQQGYYGLILSGTAAFGGDGGESAMAARSLQSATSFGLGTSVASQPGHRYGGGASGASGAGVVAAFQPGSNGAGGVIAWQAIF